MLKIERILVPIDFSVHATCALAHAGEIAAMHEAALERLHVIEEPTFPSFYNAGYEAAYGAAPDLEGEARSALERLVETAQGADASATASATTSGTGGLPPISLSLLRSTPSTSS